MIEITQSLLKKVIVPRKNNTHKGDYGKVLLVGGSPQYGGAILMAAEACVYGGSGLVTVACDKSIHASIRARLPEAMLVSYTNFSLLEELMPEMDAILIGPGLGTSLLSKELFKFVLSRHECYQKLVIDGSALSLLADEKPTLLFPEKTILTPHAMEWERISRLKIANQTLEKNQKIQQKLKAIVVLKGHRSVIYSNEDPRVNSVGTPAQATGGMGDTLAGMITCFLGQFKEATLLDSISAALFLHSFIAEELGVNQYVVLPTQISEKLPYYMKKTSE